MKGRGNSSPPPSALQRRKRYGRVCVEAAVPQVEISFYGPQRSCTPGAPQPHTCKQQTQTEMVAWKAPFLTGSKFQCWHLLDCDYGVVKEGSDLPECPGTGWATSGHEPSTPFLAFLGKSA